MSIRFPLLSILLCGLFASHAQAHGLLVAPEPRTESDYQFNGPCHDFPDPGEVITTYQEGQDLTVVVNITLTHGSGDQFHLQICPSTEISEACFLAGEFAAFENDGLAGLHHFETRLPDGLSCESCVLRWKWDYAFLSCADIKILGAAVPLPGDANSDGVVNGADYTIWADHSGAETGAGPQDGDFNGDGRTDGADYTIWADHYGDTESTR